MEILLPDKESTPFDGTVKLTDLPFSKSVAILVNFIESLITLTWRRLVLKPNVSAFEPSE